MKQSKKLIALLLTLAMVLSFIPVNVAKAITGNTTVTFDNPWVIGDVIVTAYQGNEELSGAVELAPNDEITLDNFNSETMEALLTADDDDFQTFLTVDSGKTSLSTAEAEGVPSNTTIRFVVRAKDNGGGGGNNEGRAATLSFPNATVSTADNTATYTVNDGTQDINIVVTITKGTNDTWDATGDSPVLNIANNNDVSFALDENFDADNMTLSVNSTMDDWGSPLAVNENTASLGGLNFPEDGNLALSVTYGNNGGGDPQPGGNKTAKITISGMDLNGKETWTGIPGTGHEEIETRYDRYWYVAQFAINVEDGQYGDTTNRWDGFSWEREYSDEEYDDAAATYGSDTINFDRDDEAETVDINVYLRDFGDRIDAIWINGVDYSAQLHVDADHKIFDDEASMLTLFQDQGICFTIENVPVKACEDDGIDDEYDIKIAASPNSKCFIGNFLWTQDDYFAPYDQGGIEPSDSYIGKSELTLMDIYYYDGTFDREQQAKPETAQEDIDFVQFEDSDGHTYWYKHIEVPGNADSYTNQEMPAIHYQLDREGEAITKEINGIRTNVVTSEMVMPVGTWVKMKIQPEQGYQVDSFSGVNRNAGNVRILSDNNNDACVFMFKIDSGNFHIGANVVPKDDTTNVKESNNVSEANVSLEAGAIDGGTAELAVVDVVLAEGDEKPFVADGALAGNDKEDFEVKACLDLSMNQVYEKGGVQDKDSDAAWKTEVGNDATGLNGHSATITLQLDESVDLAGKNVQVVHKNTHADGNQVEYQNVTVKEYNPETNTISFDAESFSEYAIVAKEVTEPTENKATIRVNTALGVLSGNDAVFTYKDGDETVGTVRTSNAAVVVQDNVYDDASLMYVTAGDSATFYLEPVSDAYEPQVCTDGTTWVPIEKNDQNKYVHTVDNLQLTANGEPVVDVQFRFECTRTYPISFVVPTLTVGEGTDEEATANITGIQNYNNLLQEGIIVPNTNIAELGAKDVITLTGFDSERMVVRLTATGDTTGWTKVLMPNNGEVTLGIFDMPEGSTGLEFRLVEKVENNQSGQDDGPGIAEVRFHDPIDIQMNNTTGVVTVTYLDDNDIEVDIIITADEGVIDAVDTFELGDDESGEHWTDYVLFSTGGTLTIALPDAPEHTRACWSVEQDGEPGEPIEFEFDELNRTTLDTDPGKAYDVDFSFKEEPQLEIIPASDSAEDVSAANAVNELVNQIMEGESPAGISNELLGEMEEAFYNGEAIVIELSKEPVTEAQVANDAKAIKNKIKSSEKLGALFDVDVNVWINGALAGQITELPTPVTISLKLSDELKKVPAGYRREYRIGGIHDGAFTSYKTTLSASGEYASANVKLFSTYAIIYEDIPEKTSTGTITSTGIFCMQDNPSIIAGMVIKKSDTKDDVEYRWIAIDENNQSQGWFEISPWTKNNEWLNWTPKAAGNYVIVCQARVVGNEENSMIQESAGVVYSKSVIKGICQMPYEGEGGGYLIGIESFDNPNQSYRYEMLILDCTLLAQGKDAWIYTTGQCGVSEGNALWTIWQPQYGYYWTLFRVYDADGNKLEEQCFGFANVY